MFKMIAVAAAIASTAAFAAPSFDAYVEQDTDSFVAYGVGASYESLRLDIESDETNAVYITAGISQKVDLGNGFSFTPSAQYAIDLDDDFNKTAHQTRFRGMFGYAVSDALSLRTGTQYRFRSGDTDQTRLIAGVNYQLSDALNVDYDFQLRAAHERGEFVTNLSDYTAHNELKFTATAIPYVEPYATLGYTSGQGSSDTYAIVGLGFAF